MDTRLDLDLATSFRPGGEIAEYKTKTVTDQKVIWTQSFQCMAMDEPSKTH